MASTPEETFNRAPSKNTPSGDEVVISGMSGIFPKSESVEEFMKNLYKKEDTITSNDSRWVFDHPEMPNYLGKVRGARKFDAQFFKVHHKQAISMEPMSRKLLEHSYGAIYDSGINPFLLRGKKIGVFFGAAFSEFENTIIYDGRCNRNGFGISGCNKSMYANRVSYWLDAKGPSYTLDVACASSMVCIDHAYRSILSGQCDAALVGGSNICMHPLVSLNFKRAGFLCLDGKTKCFDKKGDGYVRSDAISVLFLQKAKDAKRVYSEVYHTKASYSSSPEPLLPVRDPKELQQFFEEFYAEIDVSPKDVEYVEANGAAFAAADISELTAIGKVFAKEKPIKIGCVKSNMGSSEPASGACALTKVCLAYHNGKIPGNLHYNEPLDIQAVKEHKIQVLIDTTNFNRGFTALNSLSYSGVNVHVLLKGNYKEKCLDRYKSSIPHLVLASGRQESSLEVLMDILKKKPIDPEEIGLLHNIHQSEIPGHMSRGFSILGTNENNETVCLSESIEYYPGTKREIWFLYSGMGSQWATMGTELMRIPVFAAAIQKCHKVLEPKGIDIVHILTHPDKSIYNNILHSFVGIAAVQIGLTDILTKMKIVPDHIIGHSVGELGCAYADGCFTAEEMILSAYNRGLVSVQTPFIRGSMAAVGLGYKNILPLCPPEIEVACHNSAESSTISGPLDVMKEFVSQLTSRGIFAKEVPCSNIAYHSRYIADAGPCLLKNLREVIKTPRLRSKKWVSTSVPQDKWNEPEASYSSAEYHTNNLLNSVLFEETSKSIPSDALVIEIAPHGLLQAILKRSLSSCVHVPLTKRGIADPIKYFLVAVGKLFQEGLNPKVDILYPKIEYPVSTGTPFLSQYVRWVHSEDWPEASFNSKDRIISKICEYFISLHDDDYGFLRGHVRQGNYVFPEAAILQLVWQTLAMYQGVYYKDLSVEFHDVHFCKETKIKEDQMLKLVVMINKGNDKFEVTFKDSIIAKGLVKVLETPFGHHNLSEKSNETDSDISLSAADVYTMMRVKGYSYMYEFQSIQSSNSNRTKASIRWTENWITFLDAIFQLNAFANDHDGVSTPSLIKKLTINVEEQVNKVKSTYDDGFVCDADINRIHKYTKCGGVEIDGLEFVDTPVFEQQPDMLLIREFVPYFTTGQKMKLKTALQIIIQLVCENVDTNNVKVTDILLNKSNRVIELEMRNAAIELPTLELTVTSVSDILDMDGWMDNSLAETNLVVIENLLVNEQKMEKLYNCLKSGTFILAVEQDTVNIQTNYTFFNIIATLSVHNQSLILLRKINKLVNTTVKYLPIVEDREFKWTTRMLEELTNSQKVVLVSERQPYSGSSGMLQKLREDYGNRIELLIIDDAPRFNPQNSMFSKQLQKNLAVNVFKKGMWGNYFYISETTYVSAQNVKLITTVLNGIKKLTWEEQPVSTSSSMNIQVCYAGLSFNDASNAVSQMSQDKLKYGMDYSGINNRGEKVMGLVSEGAIANTLIADPDLLWPVPEYWTLEEAATVPLPYTLAYYCLIMRCQKIQVKISNILVTGGASAVGQAMISVCLQANYTVYTLVIDQSQKAFLLKLFPGLNEINIFCANAFDTSFQDMVRSNNKSYTVINCLRGKMREAAMNCVGFSSIFFDLSDFDMKINKEFGMASLLHYVAINLDTIFKPEYAREKKKLQIMLSQGIVEGIVKPFTRVVYSPIDVTKAFKLLSSRNLESVLIRMKGSKLLNENLEAASRMSYSSEGSYIIVSNGNILEMELADRLIKQGARRLLFNIRPNFLTGYYYSKFLCWKKLNVTVETSNENLRTVKGCMNMLNGSTKLGPVLGIFIVQNFNTESMGLQDITLKYNNTACVVANVDLTSRNICNKLEQFVVLSYLSQSATDDYMVSMTNQICIARKEIGLPALSLEVGPLKELEETTFTEEKPSISAVFNALESSLKLKYTNVKCYNPNKNTACKLIQTVSTILGFDVSAIDDNISLNDLPVNDDMIDKINKAIQNAYQIDHPLEITRQMTIASLKNLKKPTSHERSKCLDGIGAFFTHIDEDEWLGAEPLVSMTTTFSNIQEDDELDPNATYLMLVPGFEGHYKVFSKACEGLKLQAMAFQYGPELTNASIAEMATFMMQFIKNRTKLKSKFYLLGYSFGVNVALELAALFEKQGHIGVVYCLDSSPDALRAQLDAYVGHFSDAQLQNNLVKHLFRLMNGQDSEGLMQKLEQVDSWEEKIELCVKKLRGIANISHQYKRCILQGAYRRIMLAREYQPNFKLQSEVVLIKGIPHPKMEKLADDYGLSKYTTKPVKVYDIEANHVSAPYDCKITSIVNRLLEPKLLEKFKNKNLCWSYLTQQIG